MSMNRLFHGPNAGYVLELYEQYARDPESVDVDTRTIFERWTPDGANGAAAVRTDVDLTRVVAAIDLAQSIRRSGHRAARLDPLGSDPPGDPSLDPGNHGLSQDDLAALPASIVGGPLASRATSASEAIGMLRASYCQTTGFDFEHVQNAEERAWLFDSVESGTFHQELSDAEKRSLLEMLTHVEAYEKFTHRAYFGAKRFSVEGNDMLVPMIDEVVHRAAGDDIGHVVIGMAHRGRLSTLLHILGKTYEQVFAQFAGKGPGHVVGADGWTGDVKYHMGWEREPGDLGVRVSVASNPSHLEFVNPVVTGMARAVQERRDAVGQPALDVDRCLPVQIHGDASFPGEGIVTETLNLSQIPGYTVGGSLHIIVNNQIGFTTEPWQGRSTLYSSDMARGFEIPIIHVNADDVAACVAAIRMAYAYRQKFHKDFLIDLVGYRRWGHNEGDEPGFTQPSRYARISDHPTVRALWAETLDRQGVVTLDESNQIDHAAMAELAEVKKTIDADDYAPSHDDVTEPANDAANHVETAVPRDLLMELNEHIHVLPEDFALNPKLRRQMQRRAGAPGSDAPLDWAHAEALALAAILADGTPIRMEGQDTERGTFSQRHLFFHDVAAGGRVCPLQYLPHAKASFSVYNSPLTETATIGFDYGYSVQAPESLVIWEAQFGDFVNVGQVIIDQFISAARGKWRQDSSLVLLLPHGYEGQGPEHSSGRVERFLQLAAQDNMRVANCTTSAQYFHLLRRQAALLESSPRPLIVMTPKSLLRHPKAGSPIEDLASGRFYPVLDDDRASQDPEPVTRLVLCSGKVYVDLISSEQYEDARGVALVRVEQLYPLPEAELREIVAAYPNLTEIAWLQEEPKNMGAWTYMLSRLMETDIIPEGLRLRYIGRPERASPAEGYPEMHNAEQSRIVNEAFQDVKVPEETYGVKHAD